MSTDPATQVEQTVAAAPAAAEPTTAVIVRKADDFVRLLGDQAAAPIHNFDGDEMAQWRLIANAKNGTHGDIVVARGRDIPLRYFYVHPVRVNGRTAGEFVDTVRCVIIDTEGKSYAFVSEGIAQSLADLVNAVGFGPWQQPPLIAIKEGKTRAGRNFYAIVPA